HAADVHRSEPSVQQREKEAAEVLRGGDEVVLVGCPQDRVAKGEWAAHLDAHQVGGGEDAEDIPQRVDDDQVVGVGVQQVDDRIHGEPVRSDGDRARGDTGDGAFRRDVFRKDASAQGGVGEDQQVRTVVDEDRGG